VPPLDIGSNQAWTNSTEWLANRQEVRSWTCHPQVAAQPLPDKRKERAGRGPFQPWIVTAMLQLPVLELRQIWPQRLRGKAARMRIEGPVHHQHRHFDCCECGGVSAFCLQAQRVIPSLLERARVNLVVRMRETQWIIGV